MDYYNLLLNRLVNASYLLDMCQDEVWREIDFLPREENECRYFVSNYGSVISLCRETPIILKPFLCGEDGNKYYCITIGGHEYRLNRLVA